MKEYIGTKFQTIFLGKDIQRVPKINELKKWGKKFSEMGFIPHYKNEKEPDRLSSAGNLSFRNNNGFGFFELYGYKYLFVHNPAINFTGYKTL